MATSSCARRRRSTELRYRQRPDGRAGAEKAKLPANIIVDCSHANSFKKAELQPLVMSDVVNQIRLGNQSLVGVMIESNLVAGNQPIPEDRSQLKYGCSVTDACIGWDATEKMLREAAELLRDVLPKRNH